MTRRREAREQAFQIIFEKSFMDESVEEIMKNAAEVRKILEESGRVHLVLQGHYHPGAEHEHNGIRYTTFPAMCERDDAVFVLEV